MSTVLNVGAGQQYQSLASAIAGANQLGSNVVIKILAGTYANDGGTITASNVTVEGMGGLAKLVGASAGTGGKSAITAAGNNIILTNIDISGVTGAGNAGVLYTGGTLHLDGVDVHDNQTGVATTNVTGGVLDIETSHIDHNGSVSGGGDIDVGAIGTFTLYGTAVRDAVGGFEVRSLAQTDTLTYSVVADVSGAADHAVELPQGGKVTIFDTTIERGPNAMTKSMISWGSAGTTYAGSSMTINEAAFINDAYPNTGVTLFDKTPAALTFPYPSAAWNLPSLGIAAPADAVVAMSARNIYVNFDPTGGYSHPAITTLTGMSDGGVTLRGWAWGLNTTVSVSETVDGKTTLLGTAAVGPNASWSLTSHVKIDQSRVHSYTMSMVDGSGSVDRMHGSLILADTGSDHLIASASESDVFTIMSFKGVDIIDGFKTTLATSYGIHDLIDLSGRGISSFSQVQAMMSGSASTILTMSSGKTVTLTGVAPGSLSSSDFRYS